MLTTSEKQIKEQYKINIYNILLQEKTIIFIIIVHINPIAPIILLY